MVNVGRLSVPSFVLVIKVDFWTNVRNAKRTVVLLCVQLQMRHALLYAKPLLANGRARNQQIVHIQRANCNAKLQRAPQIQLLRHLRHLL